MSEQERIAEDLGGYYNAHTKRELWGIAKGLLAQLAEAQRREQALAELVAAQDDLLVAYRLGPTRRGSRAADRVGKARAALRAVGALKT